jgi:hypothetical protein
MYFVSFAVVGWVDVFTREDYRDVVIESLKYCQKEEEYIYSSARDYYYGKQSGLLKIEFLI